MELNLVLNQINSKFFVKINLEPKILKLQKKPILRSDQKLPRKPRKFEKLKLRPKRLFLKSRIKQQQLTTTLNPKTQLNPTHPDKAKLWGMSRNSKGFKHGLVVIGLWGKLCNIFCTFQVFPSAWYLNTQKGNC